MYIKNLFLFYLICNIFSFLPNFTFSTTSNIYDVEIILDERKVFIEDKGFNKTIIRRIIKVNNYKGVNKFQYLTINYDKNYDEVIVNKVYKIHSSTKEEVDVSLFTTTESSATEIFH